MSRKRKTKVQTIRPIIHPHVAGADIGAREIYVAVPTEGCAEPLRCFPTFTEDLRRIVAWLQEQKIESVAMEATSVYWIPLAELLEEARIEVCLVNLRHVKNVPGRKTDVMDCQWLQYLHAVGLLRGAFRPPAQERAARALWRHRHALVRHQSWHIQHLHKALDQMNLQVHHVIADITGATGLSMLDAILAGERDPARLAACATIGSRPPKRCCAKPWSETTARNICSAWPRPWPATALFSRKSWSWTKPSPSAWRS